MQHLAMKTEPKEAWLKEIVLSSLHQLYGDKAHADQIVFQSTRKEFPGDITLVCFGLTKLSGKNPAQTAQEIGEKLCQHSTEIVRFNIVNGFLNIELSFNYWTSYIQSSSSDVSIPASGKSKVMIEYSSPNTNKPLHLGHIRNNLLGFSVSRIMQAAGHEVVKVNLVNDRGIHICKSMIAWKLSGKNETPDSSGIKGDHLVGKYYVEFDKALKVEAQGILDQLEQGNYSNLSDESRNKAKELLAKIATTEDAQKVNALKDDLKLLVNNQTELMRQAQQMLRDWENGDSDVIGLWKKMNAWVYKGFDETYKRLGVDFDHFYYESNTYVLGKDIIDEGLESRVLYQKEDGSVWIDLTAEGLDHKLLLRSDGTSVYMTQDLGTALLRHKELNCSSYVYVVGNEQDYHFKVLSHTLQKLGYAWAKGIYHLSYGMVDLPSGKMKSREGTVVDADDLIEDVIQEAQERSEELGKNDEMNAEEKVQLYSKIGLGALKYFILKVDPKKRMVFNPSESIDLNGNTGPFIQYTYARIQSIIRKAQTQIPVDFNAVLLEDEIRHRSLIRMLEQYRETVELASESYSPAMVANYAYDLAKEFNQFYHTFDIIKESNVNTASFRLLLAKKVGETLKQCFYLLGIEMPERM
ncbi:MAG TPA: arginine--tRNA ligase [Flavobacteriales bacterium]|nr:arginine--tRNA ligase [Flavobacteriales bacterium]